MEQKLQSILANIKARLTPVVVLHIMQGVLVASIIGLGVLIYFTATKYIAMQKSASTLNALNLYADQKAAVTTQAFRKQLDVQHTIDDVILLYGQAEAQLDTTQAYYDSLQQPYLHFLQYFLLPPLNIWKDRYTGRIDDSLVGKKYLANNPYLDVNLISQWTDFFKNIGINSPKNEIKNITVGNISEKDGGIFTMPVTVSFVAETKRSFLLLVDKVSMTSNRANISLLNEYFYHLWGVLQDKQAKIAADALAAGQQAIQQQTIEQSTIEQQQASGEVTDVSGADALPAGDAVGTTMNPAVPVAAIQAMTDAEIGEQIYLWSQSGASTFISDQDIIDAMQRTVGCEQGDGAECYFRFREKFRSIPELAYTIGLPNSNKNKALKGFLAKMPPMINVKSFTFTKEGPAGKSSSDGIRGYAGNLTIDVYGKSMNQEDVQKISAYLGTLCTNGTPLNPQIAASQIDAVISQAESVAQISNEKSKELSDLKTTLQKANAGYDGLPGFKKAVKLFEMYRMLAENRLCNTK